MTGNISSGATYLCRALKPKIILRLCYICSGKKPAAPKQRTEIEEEDDAFESFVFQHRQPKSREFSPNVTSTQKDITVM